jgi:hypothetical protein
MGASAGAAAALVRERVCPDYTGRAAGLQKKSVALIRLAGHSRLAECEALAAGRVRANPLPCMNLCLRQAGR